MFSPQLQRYARQVFDTAPIPHPDLTGLSPEDALLCRIAYGTLPVSDTAVLSLQTVLSYARHAVFLRENSPFCRDLPEDLFLHFVFYPRINSENIEDCRDFFYRQLADRIRGLSASQAALEVNRWCAEQVTYQASNDRTESPLTAYRSGFGRCGEESTFAVTALRSVGIPARQIYVPYWAHCDDNHAWVEVYTDGQWHYLGACEPEPILDRGWFTDAASRAPIACYRRFFDFTGPATASDQLIAREGCCLLYNVIHRYAAASRLTVRVQDEQGAPLPGAAVQFSVVNGAALRPVANLETDGEGLCRIRLGHVTIRLEARTAAGTAVGEITLSDDTEVTLTAGSVSQEEETLSFDCYAPPAAPVHPTTLTPAQREENQRVLTHCAAVRTARIGGYFLPEYAALEKDWQQLLRLAGGNAPALYSLYCSAPEDERPVYQAMLRAMEKKDLKDTPAELLQSHLKAALPFRDRPHFTQEILCPRIRNEMLEAWREPIQAAFPPEQKVAFAADPEYLMAYLRDAFPDGDLRYYPALDLQPTTALKLGHADEQGRRLLFVAILRTLGVPSRINPMDGGAEFYRDGSYRSVTFAAPTASLRLCPQEGSRFLYGSSYTLSRLEDGRYRVLSFPRSGRWELAPGTYRLLTANRLPNGSQLCRMTEFSLKDGQQRSLPLRLRAASPEEMLCSGTVAPFSLYDRRGTALPSEALLQRKTVLIYLDVSREPTEHILNEIISAAPALHRQQQTPALCYVLRDEGALADPTLQKALDAYPEAEVYFGSFTADADMLARKLFLEPGVWPLLLLLGPDHRAYYGTNGYQVGSFDLVLRLADCTRI